MKFASVFRAKALLIPFFIIVFFYLFVWAGLPRLVHWQAEKQVLERSGHVLKMELPQVNPFELTLRVPKLNLTTPQGEQLVAFDQLFIDISGTDLFTGLVALDQIDLKNLKLNVALLPEGKNNFTDLLLAFKTDDPEEEDSEQPAFMLTHLLLSDAVVDFQDRRTPDGLKTRFEPLNLELRDLATRSETDGDFILNAVTGLDAELKMRAQIQLSDPSVKGNLSLKGLNMAKLEPVFKPLLPTAPPVGIADLALSFEVDLKEKPASAVSTAAAALPPATAQTKVLLNNINAEIRNFSITAKPQGASAAAQFTQLNINNGSFDLQANKAELASIGLAGLQMTHANKAQALALNAIEVGPVAIDLAEQHAEVNAATVKGGLVNVKRNAKGELDLMAAINDWIPPAANTIQPTAQPADANEQSKPWTYAVNTVSLSGINAAIVDETVKPTLNVGLNNIAIETSGVTQNMNNSLPLKASLNVQSGGSIAVNGTVTPATAAAQMNVQVNALALKPAQPFIAQFAKLNLVSGSVSTQGKATYNAKEQGYTGSLTVAGLRLNETGGNKSFLEFKRLFTPSLSASVKGVNIPRLTLEGLDTALLIAKDKSSNISRILVNKEKPTTQAKAPAANKPATSTPPAFAVNIGRFNIANSELDFADESLFIPFGTRIHSLEGVVNGLSNKPGARGELALQGEIDEFGEADAKGSLNLLDPTQFMDIAVKFTNVEMRNLTAYSGTFANRKIEAGKLSMNLVYNIENQQLNSSNQVIVDNLKLGERVESPQGRDLPLELAIALLQDSNGRIDLGLPITGNLNDPQFSYGAIVWKAIGNVLTKIVTAPFRALGALFGGADEDLGSVHFAAGANTLSPSQRENLKKLAEALTTRPNLGLTVQGTWAPSDKAAIQNLQMRKAVATQAGEKLQPGESPGPLALSDEDTQKALEALFSKRLGGGELASLKAGFRKANPDQLEQGAAGKALGQLTNLFKEMRELNEAEINALKGKNFYAVLSQKLADSEEVNAAQLQTLATQRQQLVSTALTATGVAVDRVKTEAPAETKANEDNTVPIGLGVAASKQ